MSADNQVALSRIARGASGTLSKATRQAVPPFLQKLYEMVSDSATDNLIRWSESGDSFFVLDHERVAHDVLPRWFKHNNFASFVRQLNMYGFHKIPHLQQGVLKSETETELWNFEHPNFHRGQPDLLCLITRKKQATDRNQEDGQGGDKDGQSAFGTSGSNAVIDINAIVNGIAAIKRHQATISADLNELRQSNQHLWQEAIAARERHSKQQDTINRILKFLAGVFGNTGTPRKGSPADNSPLPRKRQRLMIEGTQLPSKLESLPPLEPLDGDDAPVITTLDHEDHDATTPQNRFVHVISPDASRASPAPSTAPTVESIASPDIQTPISQFPGQSTTALGNTDVLMGGSFAAPSPFIATQYPQGTTANPSVYSQSSGSSSNGSAMGALTSPSQSSHNQEVLQAIINSPGQLQRLMNLLNLQQQQSIPMPPPLDLNSTNDQSDVHYHATQFQPQPTAANSQIASANGLNNIVGPDPQTLSLLQPDDTSTFNFEPLLSNEAQLQKSYKDAADISAEVDAMQASLDSLIQNLGLDPSQIANMREAGAQPDGEPIFTTGPDEGLTPTATPDSTATSTTASANDLPPSSLNTDNGMKMDNAQYTGGIPDFDFNAFLNEFSRQQQQQQQVPGVVTSDHGISGVTDFGEYLLNEGSKQTASPHLSAYVDEVTSQSDASSPSMTRSSFIEDPVVISGGSSANRTAAASRGMNVSDRKTRKRKSDIDDHVVGNTGNERNTGSKSKRKR